MPKDTTERHDGHKVQMWVSHELYAALKDRAIRHDTSVAEELRKAANAGLDVLDGLDEIYNLLIDLRQFTRLHLEPLAFIAAMDSAKTAEYWKNQTLMSAQQAHMENPEEVLANAERIIGERATKRLQRKLQNNPSERGRGDDEDDGDETPFAE